MRTIGLSVPDWPGHAAGQHMDVRLTAADGYRAERSYSIASPPGAPLLEITVERLTGGEVSTFLTDELRLGDHLHVRGPVGGYFVWSPSGTSKPLLLVGGGTGVVPLMCMLRLRQLSGFRPRAALLYSARVREDIVYHAELTALAQHDPNLALAITLTRDSSRTWPGRVGRIDRDIVHELVAYLGEQADVFVCGRDPFVEAASELLLETGQPRNAIRTERFGPS